ncbi:MAG: 50S ribosomal protein L9 [Omnitrophica bacterium]|nr:50S ribosomal protein L9 [Candidatus Omnitrophota bacterium]
MQVILLQDVKGLGKEGDVVKAKDGYARNYLIPRKIATLFTPGAVRALEAKKKKAAQRSEKERVKAKGLAKTISQLSLTISMESGVDDALFGSVTPDAISRALKQEGIDIDKKNIAIIDPIKKLGIYNVEVELYPEVKETLRVWVVKK